MSSIIRAFTIGFIRGVTKSIDIGNCYKPRSKKDLKYGQNIASSWMHVGESIKASMQKVDSASSK